MNTDPKAFAAKLAGTENEAVDKLKEKTADVMDKVKDKTGNVSESLKEKAADALSKGADMLDGLAGKLKR